MLRKFGGHIGNENDNFLYVRQRESDYASVKEWSILKMGKYNFICSHIYFSSAESLSTAGIDYSY